MEAVTLQVTVTNGEILCVVMFTSEGETGQVNGGRVPAPLLISEKTASERWCDNMTWRLPRRQTHAVEEVVK